MNRVAVTGAAGRMGRTLVQALADIDALTLGAALEKPESTLLGSDAGELAGVGRLDVPVTDSIAGALDRFDTLIDFSVPAATLNAVELCRGARKSIVIGTTGIDADGRQIIERAAREIPIVMAPNYSVGVNLCFKLIDIAAAVLG